jgi:hypothetical protein
MVIIEDIGLVFIHIPKTAGTSIKKWMQENCNAQLAGSPHAGVGQIKEKNIKLPDNTQFFTVVRNPFARQLSHYRYHLEMHREIVKHNQQEKINDPAPVRILEELEKGFEHWFLEEKEFVRPNPRWWNYKWTNQWQWIDVDNTHIMKFENLQEDIQWLFNKTNCYSPLTTENASGSYKENYRDHYSQKLREIVEREHQRDFELFGYTF